MGIHLVFVMEGDLPQLKSSTVQKRIEARFGTLRKPEIAKKGRSRFKSILKEASYHSGLYLQDAEYWQYRIHTVGGIHI